MRRYFLYCLLPLFLGECSRPFPEGEVFLLSLLNVTTGDTRKFVFVTTNPTTGALGGVTGADNRCAQEKPGNLPGAPNDYKALIVGTGQRIACTNANCASGTAGRLNWVLQASTPYYFADGSLVFATNGNAVIFNGATVVLNQALAGGGVQWWTGLDTDWRAIGSPAGECDSSGPWTEGTILDTGDVGSGGVTNSSAISSSGLGPGCDISKNLVCVRQ